MIGPTISEILLRIYSQDSKIPTIPSFVYAWYPSRKMCGKIIKIISIDKVIAIDFLKWGATVAPDNIKEKVGSPPVNIVLKIIDEVEYGAGSNKR